MDRNLYHTLLHIYLLDGSTTAKPGPVSPKSLDSMVSRVTKFNLIILIESLSPGSTHRNCVLTYEYLSGFSDHTKLQSNFNLIYGALINVSVHPRLYH